MWPWGMWLVGMVGVGGGWTWWSEGLFQPSWFLCEVGTQVSAMGRPSYPPQQILLPSFSPTCECFSSWRADWLNWVLGNGRQFLSHRVGWWDVAVIVRIWGNPTDKKKSNLRWMGTEEVMENLHNLLQISTVWARNVFFGCKSVNNCSITD